MSAASLSALSCSPLAYLEQHGNIDNDAPSFIAIKPDGVQRGIVGTIIQRFENRGFKLVAIKLTSPGKEHLEKHYADLKDKPFFAGLVSCTHSPTIPSTSFIRPSMASPAG